MLRGLSPAELGKEHGYIFSPTGETFATFLCPSSPNGMDEFRFGKELPDLTEYPTRSIHHRPSEAVYLISEFGHP